MKIRTVIWTIPLLGLLAAPAIAARGYDDGYRQNHIDQRIDRQHQRIRQGVRSGALTQKEAKRLRKQHRYIVKLERQLTRDGHLGRHDRRVLHRELDAASKRIYRLKHNDRYRDARGHHKPYERHDRRHDDSRWSVGLTLFDRL